LATVGPILTELPPPAAAHANAAQNPPRKTQGVRGARRAKLLLCAMATFSDRLPENAPGRYYVDASCIDCDQCRALAPQIFSRHEESGMSVVTRQPETADEMALVEEVLASCATASIGNDGV
jgi:ferredoxin